MSAQIDDVTDGCNGDRAALLPGRPTDEDAAMAELLPGIQCIARALARTTRVVAADELRAIGESAVVAAARMYDPTRGVPFDAYAAFIAKGAMKNAIKRERRRQTRERPEEASGATPFEEGLTSCVRGRRARPSRAGERAYVAALDEGRFGDALGQAMAAMSERSGKLLEMHYFGDRTLREIARAFRVGYATIRRWHERALELLRIELLRRRITSPPMSTGV